MGLLWVEKKISDRGMIFDMSASHDRMVPIVSPSIGRKSQPIHAAIV
jgi:hypothetical protein